MISYIGHMKQYKDTSYYVTEDGKVWSSKSEKFLKAAITSSGYLAVSLSLNNKKHTTSIHRMVSETYLGYKFDMQVDHKNADKLDNRLSNLEWVSQSENTKRAYQNKCFSSIGRKRIADYDKVISLLNLGYKNKEVSEITGLSPSHICIIKKSQGGINW